MYDMILGLGLKCYKNIYNIVSSLLLNPYRFDIVLEEARTQSGFELIGEILFSKAQLPVSSIPKRVQEATV